MPARSHTRPHPATTGGPETRLRWWAVALPILAFLTLLSLVMNPADAHAAASDPAWTQLVERVRQLMAG
ncbi:hypothetical protein IAG44_31370 [Streptomyces roseirectus]|uniref:Uncharacterized protein n=1 Tax=Streptomyces roseirectus TaxID=2768066 RepID=A0A7H0IL46_9ACTN|nr:hypothetical protein [Streptomyces roseirectus]QNP73512.1 hypothetical protein IAG44_31370 [Streptomyces roseirectus]